ncbi:MAG TPA: phosphotransferase [Thermoanaerobaculia bacterium]|nr:phosphotransferase [Thermoanaerobaculia bacterium]
MSGIDGYRPRPLAPDGLREIVERWGGDSASVRPLRGSTNHRLYRFTRDGCPLVLRLSRQAHRDRRHIEEELAWVRFLDAGGVAVPPPVPSLAGRWVESVEHPEEGPCCAVALHQAHGLRVGYAPGRAWGEALFAEWGRTAGRIHALSRSFASPSGFRRHVLDGEALSDFASRTLPAAERWVANRLRELWREIAELPADGESYGMIHGDLTAANLLWRDGRVVVLDFDNCGYAWYAYDVAITLWVTLFHLAPNGAARDGAEAFLTPFLAAYQAEKRLEPRWVAALPLFVRFFNALTYVSFHQKDPAGKESALRRFAAANLGGGDFFTRLDLGRLCAAAGREARPS